MKKNFALLLVLLLCAGLLTACGPGADPEKNTNGDPDPDRASDSISVTDSEGSKHSSLSVSMPPAYTKPSTDSSAPTKLEKGKYLVGLTDQKNSRLIVCDLAVENWANDRAVVWEYGGISAGGIKFRENDYWGGEVVLYCGGKNAGIISYASKKLLLSVETVPGNPHSVELLPNGVFIVVGSTGNETYVYGAGKTEPSFTLPLTKGHGALWDPKYGVLWLEGDNLLQAYKVTGTAENPALEKVKGMTYHPNTSLHDMAPVYGNPDALLLTGANGVVLFDKTTGQASHNYPAGGYLKAQTYVPGVGNYPGDSVYVFTTIREDTLTYKEWGSDRVEIFVSFGDGRGKVLTRQAKGDAYYKARAWISDYQ